MVVYCVLSGEANGEAEGAEGRVMSGERGRSCVKETGMRLPWERREREAEAEAEGEG